jgi:hypothetical protein
MINILKNNENKTDTNPNDEIGDFKGSISSKILNIIEGNGKYTDNIKKNTQNGNILTTK